jgi:DNA-binding NarL/FixJ family response regulator
MRLLFADDHDLVRDAISALMLREDPGLTIVQAHSLDTALAALSGKGPFDVAILDLNMPGMDGREGIVRFRRAATQMPTIILSGSDRIEDVAGALDAGANGYLPKTMASRVLLNAVKLVAAGETYVPAILMERVHQMRAGLERRSGILTPRERQVLLELRRGGSNKQIARDLDIQETTVKLHLRTLAGKLHARNRTDIVLRAMDNGLV